MLEKDFDRLIKDRFADHVSDVPGDLWLRIRVKEKKRRAILFWRWYLGGFLLLAGLLTGGALVFPHGFTHQSAHQKSSGNPKSSVNPASPITRTTRINRTNSVAPASPIDPTPSVNSAPNRNPASPITRTTRIDPAASVNLATPFTASTTHTTASPAATPKTITTRLSNPSRRELERTPVMAPLHRTLSFTIKAPPISLARPRNSAIETIPHKRQALYLSLYGSPDLPLTANHSFTYQRRGLSYTGGFRVIRQVGGFTATLGLQLTRFNLKPEYDSFVVNGAKNFYCLDLPVLVGYTWEHDNFSVGGNIGAIVNLYSWATGFPPASSIPGPMRVQYEHNAGVSWYLGLIVTQRLGSSRYSLFAEPYYRRPLSSSLLIEKPVRMFGAGGLTLGIRRQF